MQRAIGTLDLLDLDVISEFYGRDALPYPFQYTRPSRFATRDESDAYTVTVPDRFHHGDLKVFVKGVDAYANAEVRVESHVQYIPADTPSVRMIAYRCGLSGFVARQLPDADAIEVHAISPHELSAAVASAAGLTGPGRHPRVVVPEYAPMPTAGDDLDAVVVRRAAGSLGDSTIPASRVTAYATVQTHWRPTRNWGPDRGRPMVVWIRVEDDGEYLYAPDESHAVPMTESALCERIDRHIARDLALLRDYLDE